VGPTPRHMKKNLPGRGLTKVQKHWYRKVVPLLVSSLKDVVGQIVELTATTQPGWQSSRLPS